MIIYSKRNGYYYEDETTGERFALVELKALGADLTTDIVGIWDEENNRFRGYFMGATLYDNDPKQLDELVQQYIEKPQQKATEPVVSYAFNRNGVNAFKQDVLDDILDRNICEWFTLTHAGRTIRIPDTAMAFEGLEVFLDEAIDDWDVEE